MSRYPGKKLIYSNTDELMVMNISALLSHNDIENLVNNKHLVDVVLPRIIAPIEIWVNESDFLNAQKIVSDNLNSSNENKASWRCSNCKEEIEGQFTECWSCSSSN